VCHKIGPFPGKRKESYACVYDDCSVPSLRNEELLANAILMASAPEMLEALRNLENDNGSIPRHAWKLVQDAIAKAEGR